MTEEILKAAILQLKSQATGRFAIIKDLYHRPATTETVDLIVQHSVALAQLEGAMITLQQYSGSLAKQTEAEAESNAPDEEVTEVEVEEDDDAVEDDDESLSHDDLMEKSPTYRDSIKKRELLKKGKKSES